MKPSHDDTSVSKENNAKRMPSKKVRWGEDQTQEFKSSPGRNELAQAINSGDAVRIYNVLQYMDHDKAKKYLTANEGLWMGVGLSKIVKNNFQKKIYDGKVLKNVIYKFMEFDPKMISDLFAGFALDPIRNKESMTSDQFLKDYHEVIRNFSKMREVGGSSLATSDNASRIPQQEEVKDAESDNVSAVNSSSPSTVDADSSNNQEVHTRASLSIVSDEEEAKNHNDHTQENKTVESTSENVTDPISLLSHTLSWIYQLPEYLQNQMLNSAPIKALIEAAEQMATIYDVMTVEAFLAKLLPAEPEAVTDSCENDTNDVVQVHASPTDAIDMSMILNEPEVNGLIMPMADVGSNLFANHDAVFNGWFDVF